MKKIFWIVLGFSICVSIVIIATNDIEMVKTEESSLYMEVPNEVQSVGYELRELKEFFEGKNTNVPQEMGGAVVPLRFSDVNAEFPTEIVGKGYSMYKVKEGGYYYVFWRKTYRSTETMARENVEVMFSAYIPVSQEESMFDTLEAGISTATDVSIIDPAFYINLVMSSGIYSFSYLNHENVLGIKYYDVSGKIDGYDDLIIEEIFILPRNQAPCVYSRLKSKDLPE
ncbi:MAG: hypothetical protein IJ315_06150 [Firmicutes bacterium]|nr:hypothetical protein [Bacillota bacterium]